MTRNGYPALGSRENTHRKVDIYTMSHITTIALKVRSMQALQAAAERLGLSYDPNATVFKTYSVRPTEGKLYNPTNKNMYEIGLKKLEDGSYDLMVDYFDGGNGLNAIINSGEVGKWQEPVDDAGRLLQFYAEETAYMDLTEQGYSVERITLPNGELELRAMSY